jgi:hypothetical protein
VKSKYDFGTKQNNPTKKQKESQTKWQINIRPIKKKYHQRYGLDPIGPFWLLNLVRQARSGVPWSSILVNAPGNIPAILYSYI